MTEMEPPGSRDEKIGHRQAELLEAILAELKDIKQRLPAYRLVPISAEQPE